jgi:hypothetical protein
MLTAHGRTPEQMIDELMLVGRENPGPRCHLHGQLLWVHQDHFDFLVTRNGKSREIKVPQSVCRYERDSSSTALIEIAAELAEALELTDFVLTEDEVERRREAVREFNAPLASRTPDRKPETVSGIRI